MEASNIEMQDLSGQADGLIPVSGLAGIMHWVLEELTQSVSRIRREIAGVEPYMVVVEASNIEMHDLSGQADRTSGDHSRSIKSVDGID